MNATTSGAANGGRRTNTTMAAFLVGLPMAAAVLASVHFGAAHLAAMQELEHYVSNPVECVEVVLFCCAISALGAKVLRSRIERRACRADRLPAWDGRPVPIAEAAKLLATVQQMPARLRNTFLGQRLIAVLEFLRQRGAADDLDDQLRTLADNDVVSMEGGFALTRFITWAIPILGFLGTVLGITTAIHGATPDVLEKNLSAVTDGLSYAFDATALALALTMITMFISFLVERDEQGVLDTVDRMIDRCLAHRFQRVGADAGPFVQAVQQNTQVLLDAMGQLVQRQAEVWGTTVAEMDKRFEAFHAGPREQFIGTVQQALELALTAHAQKLSAMEGKSLERTGKLVETMASLAAAVRDTGREQQAALVRVAEGVAAQAAVLGRLQEGETNLVHLQAVLHQNLAALANASSFDQAVHSLTAAVHLLTSRTAAQSGGAAPPTLRLGKVA
jgi:biopolymer transport protein ExbB/TolQ